MNKICIIAVAFGMACVPAAAADMPVKAAPLAPLPVLSLNHFYMGFNFGGAAGTVDALTPTGGAQKFTQANGQMGVTLGYGWQLANGAFLDVEADFDAMGQMANGISGLSLNNPMAFDQRIVYGGGPFETVLKTLTGIFNFSALPGFPAPPVGQAAINTKMYGFAGVSETDRSPNFGLTSAKVWEIAPEAGIGLRTQYSSGMATDVAMFAIFHDKSLCVGAPGGQACANPNAEVGVKFRLLTAPGY